MNPYFNLEEPKKVSSVEELISLNIPVSFYQPGNSERIEIEGEDIISLYSMPYETSGLFRGQIQNWPLIPKSFREEDLSVDFDQLSELDKKLKHTEGTIEFREFCKRAEVQNPDFPSNTSDRMSIAQHFGVPTPLLDWSKNVLTAAFFAIREVLSNEAFKDDPTIYIYHITDERLLSEGIPDDQDLNLYDKSSYIEPYPIDRRIQRQKAVFSYHPHPVLEPSKIPVNVYVAEWEVIHKLLELMKGFGFTEDYFFPDYSGIANAVTSKTTL